MWVASKREQNKVKEKVVPVAEGVPAGFKTTTTFYEVGSVYLRTDKGERRASGSYYTPDHIVKHILDETLGKACSEISAELQHEIDREAAQIEDGAAPTGDQAERLARLESDFANRILRLNVLDPAMGSGHFLIRACQYIAEEIATNPYSAAAPVGRDDESTLTHWKRRVAESCIFGIDMNGLAVELAKLAIWLETVARDQPLTFLDHHLRVGNSLLGAKIERLGALPGEIALRANVVERRIEEQLPTILELLAEIEDVPSEKAEQIKTKERLFATFEKAREPFRMLADLWCSDLFPKSVLTDEQYEQVIASLHRPRIFKALSEEPWFQSALMRVRTPDAAPFHWEFEFPEVFFDVSGRGKNPGFDVILGNPPYEVLSELESGRDLMGFRAFIENEPSYDPSRVGKNNLYKLFICRSLDWLANGGHFGFITPMALLGDETSTEIRKRICELGSFTSIEAFPEKDNPKRRVFQEAKLSTAVFAMVKDHPGSKGVLKPFLARVHPGRFIEDDSPSLSLSTKDIPLYDPTNFTIVSCSRSDWHLATRIMASGRLVRLRQFVEFSQGEVNETKARERGVLTANPDEGKLVRRGAGICLYVLRPESQGADLYLNVEKFLEGSGPNSKAYHHIYRRVGWQESSPQNNFRRIIAALIPAGEFCNHKINYLPEHKSEHPLEFVLGLLNSKLADWYFRLGSTNAAVNHYQIYNIPCPLFATSSSAADHEIALRSLSALKAGDLQAAFLCLLPTLSEPPFSLAVRDTIVNVVNRITAIEMNRGDIARIERSALSLDAQPFQSFIDRLFFAMAGLTDYEAVQLEERLAWMR